MLGSAICERPAMESTPNLDLPYVMPAQAQPNVTHNEAIRRLDAVVQVGVTSSGTDTPPGSPVDGERHVVGSSPTGAWASHAGELAAWQDGTWTFHEPKAGWLAWAADETMPLVFTGSDWERLDAVIGAGGSAAFSVGSLGINTSADPGNLLSVRAAYALFTHAGDSHRISINKAGSGDTASLIFKSNWTGHAEIGLAGDTDLSMKVSPDGGSFVEALKIDSTSGIVSMPQSGFLTDHAMNLLQDSGRMAGNGVVSATIGAFSFPAYLSLLNGATPSSLAKYINDNTDYGGAAGSLNPDVKGLIDKIRDVGSRRYGAEFWVAQITAGAGTAGSVSHSGHTYYEALAMAQGLRPPSLTIHVYLRAVDDTLLIHRSDGVTIHKDGSSAEDHMPVTSGEGWVSVTIHDKRGLRGFDGMTPSPVDIRCKNSGDRVLLACPALIGGLSKIDDDIGIVPAYGSWAG